MKKILVSGDSISYGYGFPLEKNEPTLWPNQLSKLLDANVTNISIPGYDNTGIFINTLAELFTNKYDLVLIQLTNLDRVCLSPNMHTRINIINTDINSLSNKLSTTTNSRFSKDQISYFHKILLELNGKYEHWQRLVGILCTIQQLVKQGHNIRIINGMLDWSEDFFSNMHSQYAKTILNYNNLPDDDINAGLEKIYRQIQDIDLSIWINPFKSFANVAVDDAPLDDHPGSRSHAIYTKMILNNLNIEST
jgi:hypothetical protein